MEALNNNLSFIAIGFVILFIGIIIWLVFTELRLKKLFRGKGAGDLESIFKDMGLSLNNLGKESENFKKQFEDVERRLKRSVQHVGIVRFNPFKDAGGDQSFAIAVLDERKNGVVVSSLYGRESNRVYAKQVVAGEAKQQLSSEEKEAIAQALLS